MVVVHERPRAVVIRLGVQVIELVHVQVAQHEVALHPLAGVVRIRCKRGLQEPEGVVAPAFFEGQHGEGVVDLVLVNLVLVVREHLLEQQDDGGAVAAAPVEGHRLLDLRVELHLVGRPQRYDLLVAVDGFVCAAQTFQALRQDEQRPRPLSPFLREVLQRLLQPGHGALEVAVLQVVGGIHLVHKCADLRVLHAVHTHRLAEGVARAHLVVHRHVRPCQPSV